MQVGGLVNILFEKNKEGAVYRIHTSFSSHSLIPSYQPSHSTFKYCTIFKYIHLWKY